MRTAWIPLLLVAGCATPGASRSAEAGESGLLRDLARLQATSNDQRVDAVAAMLRERGIAYEVQEFANRSGAGDPRPTGRNLIVTLGTGARDLVIGAHLDAEHLPDGTLSPGMTDNGAGTVVLVRLAEELRRATPSHRLRLVFFDLEEEGLLGSKAYVRAQPAGRVAAMINLDIVGYGDALAFGPASHAKNEAVHATLHGVCGKLQLHCVEFPVFPRSDDRSFEEAGVPNISLAVLPRAEVYQFWLLLNAGARSGLREGFVPRIAQIIHTAADTLDHVEPSALRLVQRAVAALLTDLDTKLARSR